MHRLLLDVFVVLIGTFVVSQALPHSPSHSPSPRSSETTVITLAGPITGLEISSSNYQFLGIPYAQSPTGTARFEAPTAYPISLKTFFHSPGPSDPHRINATAFGSMCPQATGGAEDCLFLNVFTGTTNPLALRPVMFWYLSTLKTVDLLGSMEAVLLKAPDLIPRSMAPLWQRPVSLWSLTIIDVFLCPYSI
jgi:Carboxylesterase family